MRPHLYILLCVASVGLLACGGTECATDAECGEGNRCVTSGGVFYPVRVCVAENEADVSATDAGHDMADPDRPNAQTNGQTNAQACMGATESCGTRCGDVVVENSCGDEEILDCGDCGEQGTCDGDEQTCVCPDGYSFDETQRDCVDIDECAQTEECLSETTICVNTPGSYECQCDASNGLYGPPEDCRRAPTVLEESWFGEASGDTDDTQTTVPVPAEGSDRGFVLSVISHSREPAISGLGLPWFRVGEVQCLPGETATVEVYAAYGTPTSPGVTVTFDRPTDAVVAVTAIDDAGLMSAGASPIQGNSSLDDLCSSDSNETELDISVSTPHPASAVFVVLGGNYSPSDISDFTEPRDLRRAAEHEHQGLSTVHLIADPPVDTPDQAIGVRFLETVDAASFGYIAAPIGPAQ